MRKRKNGKRIALIVLCTVLAAVLTAMVGVTVMAHSLMNKMNRVEDENSATISIQEMEQYLEEEKQQETGQGPAIRDEEVEWGQLEGTLLGESDDVINILLIGQDRRPGETRSRSDSMILCTVNRNDKTIVLTSFMRDLYVQIPGLGGNKMNAAYQWGGMALLSETMILNFGIHVDAFVEVDFSGFTKVVDTLGGVEVTMSQREADYMNTFYWGAGIDNSNWNLTAGTHVLTGEQALSFSRIRKVPTINGTRDDFGRTERQRAVLNEVLRRCKTMDAGTAYALITDLIPIVKTDISKGEIINYFLTLFPLLAGTKIQTQRIPIDGSYELTWVGSLDVVLPDLEKNRQFLYDTLIPD